MKPSLSIAFINRNEYTYDSFIMEKNNMY